MRTAIGMVELTSIARGIETADFMVKAAKVASLRACTVCPGKYMILVSGETGDVKASMAEENSAGEYIADTLLCQTSIPRCFVPSV